MPLLLSAGIHYYLLYILIKFTYKVKKKEKFVYRIYKMFLTVINFLGLKLVYLSINKISKLRYVSL